MYRTVVKAKEVEKITALPDDLKKFDSLELLITPAHPYNKKELKRRFEKVFRKAKDIKIPKDVDIDAMMNDMNNALL